MQNYQGRDDFQVIPQVLFEIIEALKPVDEAESASIERLQKIVSNLEVRGSDLTYREINIALPSFKRILLPLIQKYGSVYLGIDDLHLLDPQLQPALLGALYSFARGNQIYLKATAIENLTKLYNPDLQLGLQPPGDAQVIRLDYNLVNPGAAFDHIKSILGSYVEYVGIPSISSLAGEAALQRLTWACAGVPRDALYIFNNAMTKAIAAKRNAVAVTDINMAAADSMMEKERYVTTDVRGSVTPINRTIQDIKEFCMAEKSNAFLVHVKLNDEKYDLIHEISDLRFIHVLHPGITPEKAGEKYEVFLLDYAFYTGFRRTPSIKEVVSIQVPPSVKALRKLPRYNYDERIQ